MEDGITSSYKAVTQQPTLTLNRSHNFKPPEAEIERKVLKSFIRPPCYQTPLCIVTGSLLDSLK